MKQVFLYNTLTRSQEVLKPIKEGEIALYCCGPTVYNYAHIGNFRTYIFEDLLVRSLHLAGYQVQHVLNITDIGHLSGDDDSGEDKMLKTAQEKRQSVLEIAQFFTQHFFEDAQALNILPPTTVCAATDHITEMIQMISVLEEKGFTYQAGGNVYFDTSKDASYGHLRGYGLSQHNTHSRVGQDSAKKNAEDFVLWFTKSKFEDHALHWPSPWGPGYPGWHLECSAMSFKYLGTHFDIHCGGIDHINIHHTNEIAQNHGYCGANGANMWLHGEFLTINEQKMAKTGGMFLTVNSLKELGIAPLDYRYLCLGTHYRKPLNFHDEAIFSAKQTRAKIVQRVADLRKQNPNFADPALQQCPQNCYIQEFEEALFHDLNTPEALAALWGLLKDSQLSGCDKLASLYHMEKIFGLGLFEDDVPGNTEISAHIQALIQERETARAQKDFKKADEIRAKLLEAGIQIEDTAQGTLWKRL